jgi:hypothetical protein
MTTGWAPGSGAAWLVAWRLLKCSFRPRSTATDDDFQLWPVARVNHAVDEDWSVSLMARGRFDEDAMADSAAR